MSLRTNLSTRPFYNERAVQLLLLLIALLVAAVTIFNVSKLISLTGRDRQLSLQADAADTRTRELRRDVDRVRSGIDAPHVAEIAAAAHEANQAIDRRTFSWTELFNRLEAALPRDVKVSAVTPTIDEDRKMTIAIIVQAKSADSISEFLDALEKTGTFRHLLSREEHETLDGLIEAKLEGVYAPGATAAPGVSQ
jgi:hypothetical protein